jgi:hypothetical protein
VILWPDFAPATGKIEIVVFWDSVPFRILAIASIPKKKHVVFWESVPFRILAIASIPKKKHNSNRQE